MNPLKIAGYILSGALFFFSMITHAGNAFVTFTPLTPTVVTVKDGDFVVVKYTVTNVTRVSRYFHVQNHMKDQPWFNQLTGPGTCATDSNLNFYLDVGASCVLALRINGAKVPYKPTPYNYGPAVCTGTSDDSMNCNGPANFQDQIIITKDATRVTPLAFVGNTGASNIQQCTITSSQYISSCVSKSFSNLTPNGVTVSSTRNYMYVTDRAQNSVSKCFIENNSLTSCAVTGSFVPDPNGQLFFDQPSAVDLDSSNSRAYIANYGSGIITICTVDPGPAKNLYGCSAGISSFQHPTGVAVNTASTKIYVVDEDVTDSVYVCDLVTTSSSTIGGISNCQQITDSAAFYQPYGIAINNANTKAFVTNGNGTVTTCAVNASTGLLSNCIQSEDHFSLPKGIAISADDSLIYVVNSFGNSISRCLARDTSSCSIFPAPPSSSPFNSPDGIALLGDIL